MKREKLQGIQALRAAAILLVISSHAWWYRPPVQFAKTGVDLFFVISGFVMVYASAGRFGSFASLGPFLKSRFVRIAPLYWIATLTVLPFMTRAWSLTDLVTSMFFYPYLNRMPMLDPGWTLQYEMLFYASFAAFIFLPMRKAVACISAVLVLIVYGGRVLLQESPGLIYGPVGFYSNEILLQFILGMIVGVLYVEGLRIGRKTQLALLVAAFAMLIFSAFTFVDERLWFRFVSWGIPYALLTGSLVLTETELTFPRPILLIGNASYSIYLVHWHIVLLTFMKGYRGWMVFGAFLVAGICFYKFVERPLLALMRARPKPALSPQLAG